MQTKDEYAMKVGPCAPPKGSRYGENGQEKKTRACALLTNAVGETHDLLEGISHEATRLLDLRHHVWREGIGGIVFQDQSLDLDDVLRTLYEAERDPIDADSQHVI